MIRALFICGRARARSPTAAQLTSQWEGVEAECTGLSADADELISAEQLEWAEMVFVMENHQKARLNRQFARALRGKRIISLDIPDRFAFMDPELIDILTQKLRPLLRQPHPKGEKNDRNRRS